MTGRFLFGFGCAVFLGGALSAAEYFVSPAGSDAAAGTREAPFGTIARAMAGMSPGDIVTLLPGVYFEFVRFSGAGDAARPLTLRAEKPRTVIVTGAHREIREKRRAWRAAAPEIGLYEIDYDLPQPSRVLYDNVDLFPYKSPEELKSFTIRRGTVNFPGPRHGFAVDSRAGKLYVRLRPDGRYGDPDPNCHVMAVSPAPTTKYGPRYSLSASDSLACNLLLFRPGAGSMHLIVDGIDFETPGRAAISMMASDVTVRNCRFQGCWRGGIERVGDAERIVLENSEWHCFPIFDDVRELLMTPEAGKNSEVAWPHKSAFRGAVVPYETGICTKVGKDWIIRGNYIHDCFDALCGLGYSGVNVRIENNRFARCIDNAVELEDHGKNIVISGNLFEDAFQAVSWQPLDGPPWPGPVYIVNNCFRRTSAYREMWRRGMTPFKIGAPRYQWKRSASDGRLKGENADHIAAPGGIWICNNTFIEPSGTLIYELNWSHQRIDNIHFRNNIGIFAQLRQYPDSWTEGVAVHAGYRNNRFFWSRQKPPLESLASQSVETPEELLPGFASGDFAPKIRLPSLPVPEVKEILPTCIGAERKTEGGTGKAAGRQHAGILKKVFPGNDIWNGKQGVAL